jgi:hypothetical protein
MDVRPSLFALPLVALVAALVMPRVALAQEFRIETDVYVGDEEAPSSHTVTLFEKSAVYEFVDKPEQVIVYRQTNEDRLGQFILLDPATKRRTEIDVARVSKLMEKLTGWAAKQDDLLLKFSAKPDFKESFDDATGSLTLANKEWTYRVATYAPENGEANRDALQRYRAFTDRYAELTSMLYSSPPPGPRLVLNAALAAHNVVPVEIRRTIGGDEKNIVRAVHIFTWRLARSDRSRLDETQKQLASYEKVENEAFIAARTKQDAVRGQSK